MFNVFAVCVNAVGSNARTREPLDRTQSIRLSSPPRHVIAYASTFGDSFAIGGTRAATFIYELPFAGSEDSAFVQNRMETKVPSPASFSDGTSDVLNVSS